MTRQHATRVPGYARLLGMLALLAGIALMHVVVFATGHAHAKASAVVTAAIPHTAAHMAAETPAYSASAAGIGQPRSGEPASAAGIGDHGAIAHGGTPIARGSSQMPPAHHSAIASPSMAAPVEHDAQAGAGCDGCGAAHGGVHPCVFILALLALALGLAVLAWVGIRGRDSGMRTAWPRAVRRTRPPPWTVLSLAELAILRI